MSNQNQLMVASKPADLMAFMEKSKAQLALALPKHIGPERMLRLAVTAWSKNADLQKCDVVSIFGSVLIAAQLGLEIGVGGQGYLVPYKNRQRNAMEAQFIPGWQGLVDLVARAGRGVVWTGAVFKGDFFDYELGATPFCKHKPDSDSESFDDLEFVYAIGKINGTDSPIIEVWSKAKVIRHLNKFNKVGASHYALKDGYKNFEMYARKCPLLQVLKYMPKSIEVQKAIDAAVLADQGEKYTLDGDFIVPQNDTDDVHSHDEHGYDDRRESPPLRETEAYGVRPRSQARAEPARPARMAPEDSPEAGQQSLLQPAGGPDDRPLTEDELDLLKAKMEANAVSSGDIYNQFGIALDKLTHANYSAVLAYVRNPL